MSIAMEQVFIAVNDGAIKAVFREQEEVEYYVERMNCQGAAQSAAEYGYEIGSDESYYQNGYDGGVYFWGMAEIPLRASDDDAFVKKCGEYISVGLSGGGGEEEYTVDEIRKAMK